MSDDPRDVFVRQLAETLGRLENRDTGESIRVVKRPVDGPQTDVDLGCVWWEGVTPWGRDGNQAEDFYRVRLFRRWAHQPADDVDVLEGVHEHLLHVAGELEDLLKPLTQRTDGHETFVVREVTPDYVQQCVNAQLVANSRNRSAAGG